jgi:hypothetical protein
MWIVARQRVPFFIAKVPALHNPYGSFVLMYFFTAYSVSNLLIICVL